MVKGLLIGLLGLVITNHLIQGYFILQEKYENSKKTKKSG